MELPSTVLPALLVFEGEVGLVSRGNERGGEDGDGVARASLLHVER